MRGASPSRVLGRARRVGSLGGVFLGEDLLAYLVLAIGAAMAVGNLMAMVRPRPAPRDGDLERAPVARSVVFIVVGTVAAVWAAGSLIAG